MYELHQAGAADAGSFQQHARFCLQGELLHDGSVMFVADIVCKVVWYCSGLHAQHVQMPSSFYQNLCIHVHCTSAEYHNESHYSQVFMNVRMCTHTYIRHTRRIHAEMERITDIFSL